MGRGYNGTRGAKSGAAGSSTSSIESRISASSWKESGGQAAELDVNGVGNIIILNEEVDYDYTDDKPIYAYTVQVSTENGGWYLPTPEDAYSSMAEAKKAGIAILKNMARNPKYYQ